MGHMLGRRRDGRKLSEMTIHPENIVSVEGDSAATSSHPVESGKFYSTELSRLTVPPGSSRCQARKPQRVDSIVLPAHVETRAILAKGPINIS